MIRGALLATALIALLSRPALAGEGPAYALSWKLDPPIFLIGGGIAASILLIGEAPPVHCAPLCDAAQLNAFDRLSAGNYDKTWNLVGDVATAAALLYGPVMLVLGEGPRNGLQDALVVGEAALVSSAIQVAVSYAVARPRPRAYGTEAPLDERTDANSARSFFSGHVANGVAAAMATAIAFHRLDEDGLAVVALASGGVLTAIVGAGRIGAGSHFPTDVIAGAMVGAGVGALIPALHDSGMSLRPIAMEDSGRGIAIAGTF